MKILLNKIHSFLTKNKIIVIIIIIIGVASGLYAFFQKSSSTALIVKNSHCSVNTKDQNGGNNTVNCDTQDYSKFITETFCYDQLKDSFRVEGEKKFIDLKIQDKPILNSLTVWEGNANSNSVAPSRYTINDKIITLEVYFQDVEQLKIYCIDPKYHNDNKLYTVRYLPDK